MDKRFLRLDLELMVGLERWSRSICFQFPLHTVGYLLISVIVNNFTFIYLWLCGVSVCEYLKPEERVGSPGAGVCELPGLGAKYQTPVLFRTVNTLFFFFFLPFGNPASLLSSHGSFSSPSA